MAPTPQTKQPKHKLLTTLTNISTIGNKTTKTTNTIIIIYIIATNWCINTKTKELLQTTANKTIKNNKWNQCPFAQCATKTSLSQQLIKIFQNFIFPLHQ